MLALKLSLAAVIFLVAIFGGLPPILMGKDSNKAKFLNIGDAFARGIFLGAGFIHLLPDAGEAMTKAIGHVDYPYTGLICAGIIAFLFVFEKSVIPSYFKNISLDSKHFMAYTLAILLSIHSFLAGTALGVDDTIASLVIIFFAIIAHKSTAAFALSVRMRKSSLNTSLMLKVLCVFALMTPLGILFGAWLHHGITSHTGLLLEGIFDAIAAGTFIYIAMFSIDEVLDSGISALAFSSYFTIGIIVMAVVAIWL